MEFCNDFNYDLKFGQIGEDIIAEIFSTKKETIPNLLRHQLEEDPQRQFRRILVLPLQELVVRQGCVVSSNLGQTFELVKKWRYPPTT